MRSRHAHVLLTPTSHELTSGTQTQLPNRRMGSTALTRQDHWTVRLRHIPLHARVFGLLAAVFLIGLSAFAQAAHAAAVEIEVRVAAQRLADGRTEFAVQQRRDGEEWGERRLPRSRFFPVGASVGRWLASSPLTISLPSVGEVEVRVATQLLSDGRMEFAIQERREGGDWGERRLPGSRFFPGAAAVGRWLASSPLVASLPDDGGDVVAIEVRVATQLLSDGRMEFAVQERREGEEWGERRLPQLRFFPANAELDRWLASSPLGVSTAATGGLQVRVSAQRLDDGRTQFALQEREVEGEWGPRRLPRSRFFPAGAALDRWLASSPLTVTLSVQDPPPDVPTPAAPAAAVVVPFALPDFVNGRWLEQRYPRLASSIKRLGWTRDGVDETEAGAIQDLLYIAGSSGAVALEVVSLGWVQDGVSDVEAGAINWLNNVRSEEVLSSVVDLGWIRDGITGLEVRVTEQISYLANSDAEQALRVVGMQFLQSVEPPDLPAAKALSNLAAFRPEAFETVMAHPSIQDGITDGLVPVVATLDGVARTNAQLIDILLDPDRTSQERRTVTLPLSGEVVLSIVRTGPGSARSMDLLEHSVREVEAYMDLPLPTRYVGMLFERAVWSDFAGANFGTHVAVLPEYDVDDGSHEAKVAGSIIAHEVAHYYWNGNSTWVDEGASDVMASVAERARKGQPIRVTNPPCAYARAIAGLERLGVSSEEGADSAYGCNYSLGERLFVDLHRRLGEEAFRQGLRGLYLISLAKGGDGTQGGTGVGIDEVRAAFGGDEGGGDSTVETVAARWYEGTEPFDTSAMRAGRSNPLLVTVNGRIHLAYLAAAHEGPPVSAISADDVGDGLWLLLRWTYTVGSSTEVPLEIVHYYEDGFEFRRRSVSFTADARHNDGLWSWWVPVGRSTAVRWAPGQYRIHVYNEGRKLVELQYEVTQ